MILARDRVLNLSLPGRCIHTSCHLPLGSYLIVMNDPSFWRDEFFRCLASKEVKVYVKSDV
jgi:hypothetical protein